MPRMQTIFARASVCALALVHVTSRECVYTTDDDNLTHYAYALFDLRTHTPDDNKINLN